MRPNNLNEDPVSKSSETTSVDINNKDVASKNVEEGDFGNCLTGLEEVRSGPKPKFYVDEDDENIINIIFD